MLSLDHIIRTDKGTVTVRDIQRNLTEWVGVPCWDPFDFIGYVGDARITPEGVCSLKHGGSLIPYEPTAKPIRGDVPPTGHVDCNVCGEPLHMGCCNPSRTVVPTEPSPPPVLTDRHITVARELGFTEDEIASWGNRAEDAQHSISGVRRACLEGAGLIEKGAPLPAAVALYGDGSSPRMGLATLLTPEQEAQFRAEMEAEPPIALTDAHVRELEHAIRAEGYNILADPETGRIRLHRLTIAGWDDIPDNPWPKVGRLTEELKKLKAEHAALWETSGEREKALNDLVTEARAIALRRADALRSVMHGAKNKGSVYRISWDEVERLCKEGLGE
jgi:hypothetical protein